MAITTLKTLVLKTATVGSVKLATPADRIGLGLAMVATHSADVLSRGQFPLPSNPVPNVGSGERQVPSVEQLPQQMPAMATAEPPAGPAGCLSAPGSTAFRRPWSFAARPFAGWRSSTKRTGRTSSHPRAGLLSRFERDCQSHDRRDDRSAASAQRYPSGYRGMWESVAAATAGK